MNPEQLRYAETHEWIHVDGEMATVGVSAFALELLTDLTFIQLPDVGSTYKMGESFGEIESVKAVSDLYAPVDLEVTEINDALQVENLESEEDVEKNLLKLAEDPYEFGWLIKGKLLDPSSVEKLKDYAAYQKLCEEEGH